MIHIYIASVGFGYGAVRKDPSGGRPGVIIGTESTSNRTYLQAAIKALAQLPPHSQVTIHTNSDYLIHGMTTGAPKRRAKTRNPKAVVPNCDLWAKLDTLSSVYKITWAWTSAIQPNTYMQVALQGAATAK